MAMVASAWARARDRPPDPTCVPNAGRARFPITFGKSEACALPQGFARYLDESRESVNDGAMKELRHAGGTVVLDDEVAGALEKLADALSKAGMAAKVNIQLDGGATSIDIEVGKNPGDGHDHVLHAKPAKNAGSHLGHEEL